jgi:hypothetical protein
MPRDNKYRGTKASTKGSASSPFVKSLEMPHFAPRADRHGDRTFQIGGQLRRSNPILRLDQGSHATFPAEHKYSQTTVSGVALSGFPTAGESSAQHRRLLETEPRTRLFARRARRLPLPRDHIPPPLLGISLAFCASAWPGCGFLLPFVFT